MFLRQIKIKNIQHNTTGLAPCICQPLRRLWHYAYLLMLSVVKIRSIQLQGIQVTFFFPPVMGLLCVISIGVAVVFLGTQLRRNRVRVVSLYGIYSYAQLWINYCQLSRAGSGRLFHCWTHRCRDGRLTETRVQLEASGSAGKANV